MRDDPLSYENLMVCYRARTATEHLSLPASRRRACGTVMLRAPTSRSQCVNPSIRMEPRAIEFFAAIVCPRTLLHTTLESTPEHDVLDSQSLR